MSRLSGRLSSNGARMTSLLSSEGDYVKCPCSVHAAVSLSVVHILGHIAVLRTYMYTVHAAYCYRRSMWSFGLSVTIALQKSLNRSRCRLGCGLGWVEGSIVLDGSAHWRRLANAIEPSMSGGDEAFLSNYFDQLVIIIGAGTWAGC